MTARSSAVALFLVALTAAPAAAEDPSPDARGDTTSYSFEDQHVTGDTVNPNGEVLHVRKRGERESLIRARTHWIPELLKTAEHL